jgi:hypothetical protein
LSLFFFLRTSRQGKKKIGDCAPQKELDRGAQKEGDGEKLEEKREDWRK